MDQKLVLVRGDRGKPVRLVTVQASSGLIYVSSERALEADSGLPPPVGVPESDVFKFDPVSTSGCAQNGSGAAGPRKTTGGN